MENMSSSGEKSSFRGDQALDAQRGDIDEFIFTLKKKSVFTKFVLGGAALCCPSMCSVPPARGSPGPGALAWF